MDDADPSRGQERPRSLVGKRNDIDLRAQVIIMDMSEKAPKQREKSEPAEAEKANPVQLEEKILSDFEEENDMLDEDFDENDENLVWEEEQDENGNFDYYQRRLSPQEVERRKKERAEQEAQEKELEERTALIGRDLNQLIDQVEMSPISPQERALKFIEFAAQHNLPEADQGASESMLNHEMLSIANEEPLSEHVFAAMLKQVRIWDQILVNYPEKFSTYNQNKVLEAFIENNATRFGGMYEVFLDRHPQPFDAEAVDIILSKGDPSDIATNPSEFPISTYDKNKVLEKLCLMDKSYGLSDYYVEKFIESYPGDLDERSAEIILSKKYFHVVADHLDKFPALNFRTFAHSLATSDEHARQTIYVRKEDLPAPLREEIAKAMIENGKAVELFNHMSLAFFSEPIRHDIVGHALNDPNFNELKIDRNDLKYLKELRDFGHVEYENLAKLLLQNEQLSVEEILESIDIFPLEFRPELIYRMAETPYTDLSFFWNNSGEFGQVDFKRLYDVLHKNSGFDDILTNLHRFPDIDIDVTIRDAAHEMGGSRVLARLSSNINLLPQQTRSYLVLELMRENFSRAIEFNSSFTPPPDQQLARFVSVAGPFGSKRLYDIYKSMSRIQKDEDKDEILRNAMSAARSALLENNVRELEKIADRSDHLSGEAAKAFLRFDASEWGDHDDGTFSETIYRYIQNKDSYAPLPVEYSTATIEANRARRSKGSEEHIYSPEFKDRWPVLIGSLQEAQAAIETPSKLIGLYKEFRRTIEKQRVSLTEALERAPHEKAKENLQKRITELEGIDVRTNEGMAETFNRLYDRKKSPELTEIFRQFGFFKAFESLKERGTVLPQFKGMPLNDPSAEEISEVIEFVQHIAHQETWEKNEKFATKEVQSGLDSLFHVKALENEVKTLTQGRRKGASVNIEVIPSRDILTEFSGHIGDACWASSYEILGQFPNISSLTFIMDGRVTGASLLIDTETDKGEKLTIIRGLNPLESVINKLDIESFVDGVVGYLQDVAVERGRKLAIVIDDHAGGSSTNRPLLYAYLSGRRSGLKQVPSLRNSETEFNGYRITGNTYYLDRGESK